jgi:RNA-binding protein
MIVELTPARRRALRASAHRLKPCVIVGEAGLSPAVLAELDRSLNSHELIKVKLARGERDERDAMLAGICEALGAAPVQHIGRIVVIFRERPEAEPLAPEPVVARKRPAPATRRRMRSNPRGIKRPPSRGE